MTSTGFKAEPAWHFPDGVGSIPTHRSFPKEQSMPGTFSEEPESPPSQASPPRPPQSTPHPSQTPPRQPTPPPNTQKHYRPRTCRICLEVVLPTFHPPSESIPGILQPTPTVTYESTDPESGRLLRPCKCKGSSKYVHEGCLQAWRHADPGYGKRNYWQCPTCGFRYRLERMTWGRWISSTSTQLVLTVSIFVLTLFVMGFIADPIINFYAEPFAVFTAPKSLGQRIEPILSDEETAGWTEHFVKGLASLGLLGFVKVLVAMSPWNWLNIRGSGIMGTRSGSGGTGRDRVANISWLVVVIGVCTFLWAVYKGVRAWSRRTLEKAGERVMDVAGEEDDDDD